MAIYTETRSFSWFGFYQSITMKIRNVTLKYHDGAEVDRAAPKPTELS